MPAVKSTDPRRAKIIAAIKKKSKCHRVTCISETKAGVYVGQALVYDQTDGVRKRRMMIAGVVQVTDQEAGIL